MIQIPAALALLAGLVLAAPAHADLVPFRTPSNNIHCYGDTGREAEAFVDCEIVESDATPPQRRPADCDLDWGSRFTVDESGRGVMACYGDTVRNNGPVLGYGESATFGTITCLSSRSGLECRNAEGHGFHLARAGQELF